MNSEFFIHHNFLGLPPELSDRETSRIGILPVAYDGTTTYISGTRNGPGAILEASKNVEWFDPLVKKETCHAGIHTYPVLEPTSSPEEMLNRITEVTKDILLEGKFPVIIGGEHSISYGAVRAIREQHKQVSVLQLDAHADLRDTYGGSPYNHACVMRRISSECKHVGLGIRSMSREEAELIEKQKFQCISPMNLRDHTKVLEIVRQVLHDPVYITVDLDVFDPSIMPSVGTPEPGGITWEDAVWILGWICNNYTVVGFDVVELCPIPGLIAPDFLAAKLVYYLIGLLF